jgi:hypothetical protein
MTASRPGSALLAYTLPTLVMPPIAERLSLRFRPRVVIPAGLFTHRARLHPDAAGRRGGGRQLR